MKIIAQTVPSSTTGCSNIEEYMIWVARISSPENRENLNTTQKLLNYLIKNEHWSPFESASVSIEFSTSRAIAAQILRHRSFTFQEYSQRYAEVTAYIKPEMRMQSEKNRQSSLEVTKKHDVFVDQILDKVFEAYGKLITAGVSKETARMILPLCSETRIVMTGTIRSWYHYIKLRTTEHVQKEHRDLALQMNDLLKTVCPNIF